MLPPFQVENVAFPYEMPDLRPINFDITTREGSAKYQDLCSQMIKKLREKSLRGDWQQWEKEAACFAGLLRHNLPRSLRLAQAKNRELQSNLYIHSESLCCREMN